MNDNVEYEELVNVLSNPINNIPLLCSNEEYYPLYVQKRIEEWIKYYSDFIKPTINHLSPDSIEGKEDLTDALNNQKEGIVKTLNLYFEGRVLEATKVFNDILDNAFYQLLKPVHIIKKGKNFYRARTSEQTEFGSTDLFHVPFEERFKIATNRYSIPGLPALYLGGSTYVCWEEFNRYRFRDLYYARLCSTKDLEVIRILRLEDLLKEIKNKEPKDAVTSLWRYMGIFPITMACCITVQHKKGNFKPEYIIPQLLLQYVAENEEFNGIMYPSTKVDYSKLTNIPAYNFVFPAKTNLSKGYCEELIKAFHISQPTSLELEELVFGSDDTSFLDNDNQTLQEMRFFAGTFRRYNHTTFGLIEDRLKNRPLFYIQNDQ
jgi:hypothetical protein